MALLHRAFHLAHWLFPAGGVCLEFGVGPGNSLAWQAGRLHRQYTHSRLVGFDSFLGLPQEAPGVWRPERHAAGRWLASRRQAEERIEGLALGRIRLVDGWFSDTLTPELRNEIGQAIFINVDVDLYASTIEVLDFVGPLLQPGTIIYWDDWKDPHDRHHEPWGEHRAWDEWYGRRPAGLAVETLEVNAVLQRAMIVTAARESTLSHDHLVAIRYRALILGEMSWEDLVNGKLP